MLKSEQEILEQLVKVDQELLDARRALGDARKRFIEAETNVINNKILQEKLLEELRICKSQQVFPGEDYVLFDE